MSRIRPVVAALVLLVVTVSLAVGLTTASAAPDARSAAPKDTLVVVQGVDPRTLGPWTSVAAELGVTTQIFERLINFDAKKRVFTPALAQSWRWVNPTTLNITVRRGIKFSNGETLSGDGVVFSMRQLLNPKVGGLELSGRTANIESVKKIGPRSIQITYKRVLNPSINLAFLAQSAFMVPPKYYRQVGHKGFADKPIGTGPYKLQSRTRASKIVLTKNTLYKGFSGPAPTFNKIEFRILPEPGARVAALRSGDADIAVDVPPDNVASLRGDSNVRVVTSPGLRVMELQVDMRHGLSDASARQKVRQAIMVGIDRAAIIRAVFLGLGRPVNQLGTPGYVGFVDGLPALRYNASQARSLLAEAGFPNGVELPMACPSGRYLKDREVCQVIASELGKIGIKVPLTVLEVGAYFQGVLAGKVGPIIYIGRLSPSLNAVDLYQSSLSTSQDSYRNDPRLDQLHTAAVSATTERAQKAAMLALARYQLANPDRIPLWVLDDIYATSKRLTGWSPRPDQVLEFWGAGIGGAN